MGRPLREAASPSALGPALLRYASTHGADAALIATRAGLEPADADKDEVPITATELATMLSVTAELLGDPHLALRLPTELAFRKFDAGALAARAAPTPRAVLESIARFGVLVFPRLEASIATRPNGEVELHAQIAKAPRGLGYHVDAYVLAFALTHCRRGDMASGVPPLRPTRAWLSSARPGGDLGALIRFVGTEEIELGAEDSGFALSAADASRALPGVDPMIASAAEHLASAALSAAPSSRGGGLSKTVATRIEAMLPNEEVSAESIALAMKMSARTLQRRLDDEGIRFSTLLDEVRERIAKQLLRGDPTLSLAEIAYRVGFSDLATFSRAFKRWTGMPPGAFRRGFQGGSPPS